MTLPGIGNGISPTTPWFCVFTMTPSLYFPLMKNRSL